MHNLNKATITKQDVKMQKIEDRINRIIIKDFNTKFVVQDRPCTLK